MLTYDQIIEEINNLHKKGIIDEKKQPDINASITKEYYKNGNVKSYEITLRLKYPREILIIKNKDIEKYVASFKHAVKYLQLIFYTNFLEKRIKQYYLLMSRVHRKKVLKTDFDTLVAKQYEHLSQKRYTPKKYMQPHFDKPSIYDRKYLVSEHIKTNRKYKQETKQKMQIYESDLKEYEQKKKRQEAKKLAFYEVEYERIKQNQNVMNQIQDIKNKYNAYKQAYVSMDNEQLIEQYFTYVLKDNKMQIPSYNNLEFGFFCDLDAKAITLNVEIPDITFYPEIESLSIIKKHVTCKEKKYDDFNKNISLNSYILFQVRTIYEADHLQKFETIYVNLFKSDKQCYGILSIDVNTYKKRRNETISAPLLLSELNGLEITYDSLTTTVLPLRKGGI